MALELLAGQAEVAILLRQVAPGVVANKHHASLAVAFDDLERGENCGSGHRLKIGPSSVPGEGAYPSFHEEGDMRNAVVWPTVFPKSARWGEQIAAAMRI